MTIPRRSECTIALKDQEALPTAVYLYIQVQAVLQMVTPRNHESSDHMDTLADVSTGIYLITTYSGSRHLLNFDSLTTCRLPRTDSPDVWTLRRDSEEIDVLRIGPCEVGQRLLLILDLHLPGVGWTSRLTTAVVSIEKVDFDPTNGPSDTESPTGGHE